MRHHIQMSVVLIIALMIVSACQHVQSGATPTVDKKALPLDWPTVPLTPEQILDVKQCDVESLPKQRYPDSLASEDLIKAHQPQTDCDWAILALAYTDRMSEGEPLSEAAQRAFTNAIANNTGYALVTPLFYRYFGATTIVKPPIFAQQEITDVRIEYSWSGLANKVDYSVEIHQANTEPVATSTYSDTLRVDKPIVQALAPALTDFLPVSSRFQLQPCYDNYPVWSVSLTFADETELEATTDSNFMYIGGPWFIEKDRQAYVQYSMTFGQAVGDLFSALDLPLGQTAAMSCFGDTVFDKAFP